MGVRTSVWGASDNVNQKFTGQERDAETNLDFFQARYLSSGLGRFMSPDPHNAGAAMKNPQSWNAYAYVMGNPLNSVDPTGLDCYSRSGPQARDSGSCSGNYGPPEYGGVSIDGGSAFSAGLFGSGSGGGGGESAVQCPNNTCYGVNPILLPVQFYATAEGTSYYSCQSSGVWQTQNAAGIAAETCAIPMSVAWHAEVGGFVYSTSAGTYSFTLPQFDSLGQSNAIHFNLADLTDGDYAGFYHTHADFPYSDYFSSSHYGPGSANSSPADLEMANSPANQGQPIYLGNYTGKVLVYNPSQKGTFPTGCVLVGGEAGSMGIYVPPCP